MACLGVFQFGEFYEKVDDFVGVFIISCYDYDISFCLFGNGMLKYGFVVIEGAWDEVCIVFYYRIEGVDGVYVGFQQLEWVWFFLVGFDCLFYWEFLEYVYFVFCFVFIFEYSDGILYFVVVGWYYFCNCIVFLYFEGYYNFVGNVVFVYLFELVFGGGFFFGFS